MVEELFNSPEFLYGVIFAGIFLIIGLSIQIGSSLFADWRNHKRRLQYLDKEHEKKIDYMQKRVFFNKKLGFFDKVSKNLVQDILSLDRITRRVLKSKNLKKMSKENREKFKERLLKERRELKETEERDKDYFLQEYEFYLKDKSIFEDVGNFIRTSELACTELCEKYEDYSDEKIRELTDSFLNKMGVLRENILSKIKKELKI